MAAGKGRGASHHRGKPSKVTPRYSIVIKWSEDDQAYIARLPEFGNALTHGDTYAEAARQGEELIESFIMWYEQDGKPLPEPHSFEFETDRTEQTDARTLTAAD